MPGRGGDGRFGRPRAVPFVASQRSEESSVPSTMFDERQFEQHLSAARNARRFVADVLGRWGCDGLNDDACLAVTELVTNAVVHGCGDPKVVMVRRDDGILIEVHDASPEAPVMHVLDPLRGSGFGLHLVSGVAGSWGVRSLPPGKVVWCLLGPHSRRRTAPR